MTVAASPASSRPSQRGTRLGGFAPTVSAAYGSQARTAAGSSSTTLRMPAPPRSTAATVASAASAMCTNDQTPAPSPTIGKRRLRIASTCSPTGSSESEVPGP